MKTNDNMFGDTKHCEEDICMNNDEFNTQIMDDDNVETQRIDLDNEIQIMELAIETQVMRDDYDFVDYMDTQQLDISSNNEDCGCKSDGEGSERTEILDDTVNLKFRDTSGRESISSGSKKTSQFSGAQSKSPSFDDVATSSGSLRRGFASVRTASLRKAGLAARQSAALRKTDNGSSAVVSSLASDHLLSDDGDGTSNVKAVVLNDMEKIDKIGLSDGDKNTVVRSLVRKLFLEEDAAGMKSDGNVRGRQEELFQLPCDDDDVAGLSYVDSQEPGELSQAYALDFVDRFLKVNVFESDVGGIHNNTVAEIVSPTATAKGAQTIAQQASRKSTLAEGSIFEWDDNLEDEGGGEFFTKKKKELLGTINKTHGCCPKPWSSKHHESIGSPSIGNLLNEKRKQNLHDTLNGHFHFDLKSVNGGAKGKNKEIGIEENVDSCAGQQLGLGSCSHDEMHNTQSVDIHNVGVDTQVAAEAMEALSAGNLLVNNDCRLTDQACELEIDYSQIKATKNGTSKPCSLQKKVLISTPGVATRSRTKKNAQTRGQSVLRKYDAGLVMLIEKRSKSRINASSLVVRRESAGAAAEIIEGKQTKSILKGQINNNPLPPLKRRSLRGTTIISTPIVQEAVACAKHHLHVAVDGSGNSGEQCLEVVHERKCQINNDMVSEKSIQRNNTLDQTNAADFNVFDGSNRKRGDTEYTFIQENESSDKAFTSSAYEAPSFTVETIGRRARSRERDIDYTKSSHDEKGLSCSGMQLPNNGCLLASEKDTTPVNLKSPTSTSSPVCVGDGYYSPSCKKSLLLQKEFMSLISSEVTNTSPSKGLRLRRDIRNVRILFSQHLDEEIVRQQKKILSRLGVSVASSISEATHFVADMFVRTRNMLEAIANAKPVVTHLWLESCGQSNCFIDEKSYILRDANKEKELGFNMAKSLAHASQHPLLEGKKVLITPNAKPGKEVISSLVKAVRGQAVERLGRSTACDELFVLSCEEDFEVCVPLLEKGIAVYSSELLLNGIIKQRLEYERYRLFVSHVKKTRSTLWLKKSGGNFLPVTKTK